MRGFAQWLNSPVGQVIRDVVETKLGSPIRTTLSDAEDEKMADRQGARIAPLTGPSSPAAVSKLRPPAPRARSSTVEQGTFNPLVPGSNPGGLTVQ